MARRLSMATRRELKQAVGERYRAAGRWERRQIRDELTRVTGYSCIGRSGHDRRGRTRRRRWGLGSAVRQSVPVRTFDDWGEPPPGYCEADLVEHCGGEHEGSFAHSLTLTDIHSGWTECAAIGGR